MKGLPKQTESLCPECSKVIAADIFADDGKVMMEKSCAEHGQFPRHHLQRRRALPEDGGVELRRQPGAVEPADRRRQGCPDDCGLCGMHTSHTALANVDLTNRCNLTCPVCFANANVAGYLYEPNVEQIRAMLETLRGERPVDGRVVQFSGGEPTIHPQFFEILSHGARDGLHPHSGRHQRHRAGRPGIRARRPRQRVWRRSTCNSTASATTSIAARAGRRCSRPR